ncbi:MAG: magnesium and cobalt transport protein CorA [Pseudomonadota bacterium]
MYLMGDSLGDFASAVLHCAAWRQDGSRQECAAEQIPDLLTEEGGFLWLEMRQPSPPVLAQLQALFGVHELAIEDARQADQHIKFEAYEADETQPGAESYFMVLAPAVSAHGARDIAFGELHVFLNRRVILLLHLGHYCPSFAALERFERAPVRLGRGMNNALHAVLDEVVDDYMPWRSFFEERLDHLESQVISGRLKDLSVLTELYALKRGILHLHHAAQPLREISVALTSGAHRHGVPKHLRPYFRDVQDHLTQLLSGLDYLREAQLGAMNLSIALEANRQGVVVRKLAGWGAILAVPTMVFSMYGMNFENMPELDWKFGYPLVMLVTLAGSVLLHRWLKRSGWL